MNYKNRLYQVVENYIAKVGEIDAAEKNLREQEQRETISRVHADEHRAEYQKQRSEALYSDRPADANARKRDFDGYASRAIGVCREPNSIAAAMFLENSGVPASCSYDY